MEVIPFQILESRILTILESCFVASLPDGVDPISVSEIAPSITSEFEVELWPSDFSNELLHLSLFLTNFHVVPAY